MGPFGAVGGAIMVLFALLPGDVDFQAYRLSLGPNAEDGAFLATKHSVSAGRSLISFHDVMRWGARTEKQSALRRISERYDPVFAGPLKMAMRDTVLEIRSEASAAANAILGQLEQRARDIAEEIASCTKTRKRNRLLVAYGDVEIEIARSELASPERTKRARASALGAYREASSNDRGDKDVRLKAARVHFEGGALLEAARDSHAALIDASDANDPDGEALATHLETLFALGRYNDIRRVLSHRPASARSKRAAQLWRAIDTMPANRTTRSGQTRMTQPAQAQAQVQAPTPRRDSWPPTHA
jgi:hypothetical protein